MGRNETSSQTNNDGGTPTLITGQDVTIDMAEGDMVLISASVNGDNDTANGGMRADILEIDTGGSQTQQASSSMIHATENDPASLSLGPIVRDSNDTGVGKVRYFLQFLEIAGGTATKDQSQFSVLHFASIGNRQAKKGSSGSQGSSLRPMGSGQNVLDQRGPFAPPVP